MYRLFYRILTCQSNIVDCGIQGLMTGSTVSDVSSVVDTYDF